MRSTSSPRAATSVATRTSILPVARASTVRSRMFCGMSPLIAAAAKPRALSRSATSSVAGVGAHEDDDAVVSLGLEDAGQGLDLVRAHDLQVALAGVGARGGLALDGDLDAGPAGICLAIRRIARGHRRGEQRDLLLYGRLRRGSARPPRRSPCAASRRPRRGPVLHRGQVQRPAARGGRSRGRACRRRRGRRGAGRRAAGRRGSRRRPAAR